MALDQERLDPVENLLRSMVVNNPKELLEQATEILDSNPKLLKSEFANGLLSQAGDGAANANDLDQPERRRPALGRKRAQFSFRPSQSEASSQEDVSLNIDHLQDPDEFFSAFERLENTEKELKKLRGETSTQPIQHRVLMKERCRRPSILGKKASYKHLYSAPADNKESLVPSHKEVLQVKSLTSKVISDVLFEATEQPHASQQLEDTNGELWAVAQQKGSIAEMENRVRSLLDELLFTCRDLDGNETLSLLQENLNIRPHSLDKLSLPDLDIVQITDMKASKELVLRPRKSSSALQPVKIARISRETPAKNPTGVGSSKFSDSLPKSPLASVSKLQSHIAKLDSVKDPFSLPFGIDISPIEHCSVVERVDKHNLRPPISTNAIDTTSLSTYVGCVSQEIDESRFTYDGDLQDSIVEKDNSVGSKYNSGKLLTEDLISSFDKPVDDYSVRFDTNINITSNGLNSCSQDMVESVLPEAYGSQKSDCNLKDLAAGTAPCCGSGLDQPNPAAQSCLPVDDHLENSLVLPDKDIGEHQQSPSILSKELRKQKERPPKQSKKKPPSRRKSLAGNGSSWENGVRRSKRNRLKPLEYWTGERLLYGRVHSSLPTVIGVKKYESPSPGKDRKQRVLQVKSYVSEEFAELVRTAARH